MTYLFFIRRLKDFVFNLFIIDDYPFETLDHLLSACTDKGVLRANKYSFLLLL